MGAGYYGYRDGLYGGWPLYDRDRTINYQIGTINVDIVDAAKKQLIWEGVAEGRVTEEALANPKVTINAVVTEMMRKYPGQAEHVSQRPLSSASDRSAVSSMLNSVIHLFTRSTRSRRCLAGRRARQSRERAADSDSRSSARRVDRISVNARMAGRFALNTLDMLPEPRTQARNAVHSSGVRPMPNRVG